MKEKILDYTIIRSQSASELSTEVMNHIHAGYEPQGGLCCDDNEFFQAMVKKQLSGEL